jgi:hypothetical protein
MTATAMKLPALPFLKKQLPLPPIVRTVWPSIVTWSTREPVNLFLAHDTTIAKHKFALVVCAKCARRTQETTKCAQWCKKAFAAVYGQPLIASLTPSMWPKLGLLASPMEYALSMNMEDLIKVAFAGFYLVQLPSLLF